MTLILLYLHLAEEQALGFHRTQARHYRRAATSARRAFWVDGVGVAALLTGAWLLGWREFVFGFVAADMVQHVWIQIDFIERRIAGDAKLFHYAAGTVTAALYAAILWPAYQAGEFGWCAVRGISPWSAAGAAPVVANYLFGWVRR